MEVAVASGRVAGVAVGAAMAVGGAVGRARPQVPHCLRAIATTLTMALQQTMAPRCANWPMRTTSSCQTGAGVQVAAAMMRGLGGLVTMAPPGSRAVTNQAAIRAQSPISRS